MHPQDLIHYVASLRLGESDVTSLRSLAATLVPHNLASYQTLQKTADGHADARQWKELRHKDDVRVYKERVAAISSALPTIPSLLLLGSVPGTLDDVMSVAAAATDEQMKVTSTCLQDGVVDSKVVQVLEAPTHEQPFRHVGVKWRLHNSRDFVCVDTTGVTTTCNGERVGYSISHSVAFAQIPSFDKFGVERANLSVCSLFRQKTPDTVECYARGFFDFPTGSSELLNSLAINAVASQWLSLSKYGDCAEMKKLVWRMQLNSGPMVIEPIQLAGQRREKDGRCAVCSCRLTFSLRKTCKICQRSVCSGCSVKKLVCVMAPDRRTVLDKKRTFCTKCMCEVAGSDARAIARDELQTPERQPQDEL